MPRTMSRLAVLAAAAAVLLLPAAHGLAGGRMPCREAAVFPGAAVNALVLPYRSEASGSSPESAGSRLAELIQQELLFSMLKYESVGATELTGEPSECNVAEAIKRVSAPGERGLRHGGGLVVIWGRIYEDSGNLYVQSYVRFLVAGRREALRAELRSGDARLELDGTLPAQGTALLPRKLTRRDLAEIEARARTTLIMRKGPDDSAAGTPLSPPGSVEPLSYSVIDARGEWMYIRSVVDEPRGGWVRARMDTPEWSLRRFLPDLAYADGLAGYLRLVARDGQSARSGRVFDWMRAAFAEYEKAIGRDAAPEAQGLSRSLTGFILWNDPARRAEAAKLFREALEFTPSSAEARVLAAITAPALSKQAADRNTLTQLNQALLGAAAVDPRSASALQNLERLYTFAGGNPALSPYPGEELKGRLVIIQAAHQAVSKNPLGPKPSPVSP